MQLPISAHRNAYNLYCDELYSSAEDLFSSPRHPFFRSRTSKGPFFSVSILTTKMRVGKLLTRSTITTFFLCDLIFVVEALTRCSRIFVRKFENSVKKWRTSRQSVIFGWRTAIRQHLRIELLAQHLHLLKAKLLKLGREVWAQLLVPGLLAHFNHHMYQSSHDESDPSFSFTKFELSVLWLNWTGHRMSLLSVL